MTSQASSPLVLTRLLQSSQSVRTAPGSLRPSFAFTEQPDRALVRQVVGGLDHQHLQHDHRVVGWSSAVRSARIGKRLLKIRPERLGIDNTPIGLELIAKIAQPSKPVVEVEEARSIPINPPFAANTPMESQTHRNGEVNRSVQLRPASSKPSRASDQPSPPPVPRPAWFRSLSRCSRQDHDCRGIKARRTRHLDPPERSKVQSPLW